MRLLHVVPTYYPATYWGGPIFSVYALNNALSCMPGVELKVLTTDAAGPNISDRIDPSKLDSSLFSNYTVTFSRRIAVNSVSIELLYKLPSLIRRSDVVHLTATYSFPTFPVLLLCMFMRKPVVWSHRGAILDAYEWDGVPRKRLKRIWEFLCNIIVNRQSVISHVTSEREYAAAMARIPSAKGVIIPNGVDVPDILKIKDWCPAGKLRLIYLGRISPKKGIENLLYAIKSLKDTNVSLTIYGTGNLDYVEKLKSLADDLELKDAIVRFAGHVDGNAKIEAFRNSDVCVVPSFSENFCMVVAEALAHGVPVIASYGTPWKRIESKQCGLWVENEPQSLADAIMRIRSMQLDNMGRNGWKWMRDEFSWDLVASRMMDIYCSLVQLEEKTE